MKQYEPSRFRLSWIHLPVALALAAFGYCMQGCRDQYPLEPVACDASRLDGLWQDSSSPYWFYDFNAPRLTQWVEVGGTVVTVQHYIFATKRDSLWASGPGGERLWSVCFLNDSTAEYRRWDVFKWSPVYLLRRL